jgi:DNA-binding NtrC family response regulator
MRRIETASGQSVASPREFNSFSSVRPSSWTGRDRVLLVEPDKARRAHLRDVVREVADVDGTSDFATARAHLFSKRYDWLVTETRLGDFNGLHLVHLARASGLPIRSLVYADRQDVFIFQEAQRAGAFYEFRDRVDRALPVHLLAALPPHDRRSAVTPDRRAAPFRGGRRCTDPSISAYA